MTSGLFVYRAAAWALAHTALAGAGITAVTIRRSVASGEAVFPWSDLDYDLTVEEDSGARLALILSRHRLAKLLFPRTGQCFVLTAADLPGLAALEPMRASLNRRNLLQVRGPVPDWPSHPISSEEAARRVVFWLAEFFPIALRTGNVRNQRKFYLEMANALGILEGRWREPCLTLAEVAWHYPIPAGRIYPGALALAARASELLGRTAPRLTCVQQLGGLTLVPDGELAPAALARNPSGLVLTAEAVDLLLATHAPSLWIEHGAWLHPLGFEAPPRRAWIASARRLASPLWLRGPGFFESRNGQQEGRLAVARTILEAVAAGRHPAELLRMPATTKHTAVTYYRERYDQLKVEANELQAWADQLEENGGTAA